jgi:hypothetical protein
MSTTIAIEGAVVSVNGDRIPVRAGEAWDANDPVVRLFPHLFSDDPAHLRRTTEMVVEQATAAPGERRNVRRA